MYNSQLIRSIVMFPMNFKTKIVKQSEISAWLISVCGCKLFGGVVGRDSEQKLVRFRRAAPNLCRFVIVIVVIEHFQRV